MFVAYSKSGNLTVKKYTISWGYSVACSFLLQVMKHNLKNNYMLSQDNILFTFNVPSVIWTEYCIYKFNIHGSVHRNMTH